MSLVEIIRPVYPELLIFSAMIFETCFVITDVRCLLLADLKLGQMVSLVPDIVIHTLRVTLLSDSGYALIGYEYCARIM
ncbi:hypothetical protein KOXM_01459 [Klebsiella michiganensis]|nr:hypothetical protein BWI76_05740 [Klebsiella sp. M5al]EKP26896.1 hypothetical protein KOXM_16138 [Klebsiella michiganensis]EKP29552.1 hypothetical protein KOXM_01459 [Klebsiella michiganensis]